MIDNRDGFFILHPIHHPLPAPSTYTQEVMVPPDQQPRTGIYLTVVALIAALVLGILLDGIMSLVMWIIFGVIVAFMCYHCAVLAKGLDEMGRSGEL